MPRGSHRTPKEKAGTAARHALVLELAERGLTEREIAAELGVAHSTAQAAIKRAIKAMVLPDAEEWRKKHVARLERLYSDLAAAGGDPKVAMAIVRMLERQAKLLGLDAPTKVQVTEKPLAEMSEAELLALVARMQAEGGKVPTVVT